MFFVYAMRRVDCPSCGVTVERVPWAVGKRPLTETYAWFLATWARRMSWSEVAQAFRTSWETVFRSVEMAVARGRAHMNLEGVTAIGVDEILWHRGHKYLTLVYQINAECKRLLWVAEGRTVRSLVGFFRWLGTERSRLIEFICSDMWKPYLKVTAKKAGQAVHILDRFHIMQHFSKAIDEVRAKETRQMKQDGYEPILKRTRWCLLKRPENLTEKQDLTLAELLQYNLRTMRSRIEPMKRVARMLRNHRELILNGFRARGTISAATVEGFNNKAKLTTRKAYGFRGLKTAQIALYHALGNLPVPEITHRFC